MKIKIIKTHFGGRWFWRLMDREKIICEGGCAFKTATAAIKDAYHTIDLIVEAAKKGIEVEE